MRKLLYISILFILVFSCSEETNEQCNGIPEKHGSIMGITNIGVEISHTVENLCQQNISLYSIKIGNTETEIISIRDTNGVTDIKFKILPNTTSGSVTFNYNGNSFIMGYLEIE